MLPELPSASRMILTPHSSLGQGKEHWSSVNGQEGTVEGKGRCQSLLLNPQTLCSRHPGRFVQPLEATSREPGGTGTSSFHETSVPSATVTPGLLCPVLFIAHPCAGSTLLRADLSLENSPWLQPVPPCPSHSSWTNLR